MKTLDDLLDLWPTHAAFAKDVGMTRKHISVIVQRQSIPVRFWTPIIEAARRQAKRARAQGETALASKLDKVNADCLLALHDALSAARGQ